MLTREEFKRTSWFLYKYGGASCLDRHPGTQVPLEIPEPKGGESSVDLEVRHVQMPDGEQRFVPFQPGEALPEGWTLVEDK